jgi:hypothetical protein
MRKEGKVIGSKEDSQKENKKVGSKESGKQWIEASQTDRKKMEDGWMNGYADRI